MDLLRQYYSLLFSLTCELDPIQTGGYYYLFTSFDICCSGTSSTYNISISRATSITGPYTDESGVAALGGGTEIFGMHGTIYGPGGQSLHDDNDAVAIFYRMYLGSRCVWYGSTDSRFR